jgi:hypothetical protein
MKKIKLLICINITAAIFIAAGLILSLRPGALLYEQNSAERFAKDYVQLSLFYDADTGISKAGYLSSNRSLEKKLVEGSHPETYAAAYSSLQTKALIKTTDGKSADATAILAGGDYFSFHPYELLSGNYFDSETVSPNVIIIDKTTAWQLFGAYDIAGKLVMINDSPFEIYGVIEPSHDRFSEKTYGDKPRVYISFEAADKIIKGFDDSAQAINVVEYILPNPVKSTAVNIVKDTFSVSDDTINITVKENSGRFSPSKIIPKIPKLGTLGVRDKPLVYPFYENAAVIAETELTFIWTGILLFALIPFVTIIILIHAAVKRRKIIAKKCFAGLKKAAKFTVSGTKKLLGKIKKPKNKTNQNGGTT